MNNIKLNNIKKAFTLAEVLITLTIIGVVAAITIPSFIADQDERATVTRVKKFNSTMQQAYKLAVAEYGPITRWNVKRDLSPMDITSEYEKRREYGRRDGIQAVKFVSYFKPYLNIARDCGTSSTYVEDTAEHIKAADDEAENKACIFYGRGYNSDGFKVKTKYLNGELNQGAWYDTANSYYKMILTDGSFLAIRINYDGGEYCHGDEGRTMPNNVCGAAIIDVNGDKKPNTVGMDIFGLLITTKGIEYTRNDDCNKNVAGIGGMGWYCIKHIIEKGNMNYLDK